ncbi:MAG TPA: dihydrodipicolinate synthase family protein [Bacteroidota bacterium]
MESLTTKRTLHGVLPPMVTPFKEDGEVDYDGFTSNLERWNSDDLAGYVVLGSNSETAFLAPEEKLKLIELTIQHAAKERVVIAGTGVESTRDTIVLTNKAARLGVQAALVLTPHYYGEAMTDGVLIRYYTDVAEQSEIPIFIYNVPKFSHVNISVHAVKTLSQHPNIIGMKDSAGNVEQLRTFYSAVPREFNLLVGTVGIWLAALEIGIRAGVHAAANCLPNQCSEIQRCFESGDLARAKEIQERVIPVNKAVTATYGVPGLKYATTLMGYKGGYPRKPLLPLKEDEKQEIQKIVREAGF